MINCVGYNANIGDFRTLELIESYHNQNPNMSYGQLRSAILQAQRYQAYSTPSQLDDRFYMNELTKSNHNLIESTEGYHEWALKTGQQQAANPFLVQGRHGACS
jgi:hypothetical protein